MSTPKPQTITVEFDDGSKRIAPFETLPHFLQSEIMRQPFTSKPNPQPEGQSFILLEWDDGWKEVIQLDSTCTEIHRYYVISREEHVGRLSLKKPDGYPELLEITRKPFSLEKITFLDTFRLALERSEKEGMKAEHFFALAKEENSLSEMIDALRRAVREAGMDLQVLSSQESDVPLEVYEEIRQKLGIKAGFRQQDVLDFITYLSKAASLE